MGELTIQEKFDAYIKKVVGTGRFEIEHLKEPERLFFSDLKEGIQAIIDEARQDDDVQKAGSMPFVYFDFIDDMSLNANAGYDDEGNEFIGLNYGAVLVLRDLFYRLLTLKNVLPEIGTSAQEENAPKLLYLSVSYAEVQDFFSQYHLESIVLPDDEIRAKHARLLTEFVILFLIDHEIAHLRFGHVHYKKSKTGQSFIMEFDANPSETTQQFTPEINKALEWHADHWAAERAVRRLFSELSDIDKFESIYNSFSDVELAGLANWLSSIWVLFRLTEIARVSAGRKVSIKYPAPTDRLLAAQFVQGSIWLNATIKDVGRTWKMVVLSTDLLVEFEKGLMELSMATPNREEFKNYVLDFSRNGLDNTFEAKTRSFFVSDIMPELLPFTRGTIDHIET